MAGTAGDMLAIRIFNDVAAVLNKAKRNGTVFGIHDWLNYLQDQAAKYRKLVEQADDPFVKTALLALASVCDEIADSLFVIGALKRADD